MKKAEYFPMLWEPSTLISKTTCVGQRQELAELSLTFGELAAVAQRCAVAVMEFQVIQEHGHVSASV